jgi:hypothetical protein
LQVRQADGLAAALVAAPSQAIAVVIIESRKLARAAWPGRVTFLRLESIAVADVDRAVGAPFPAAVINVEVMAMAVMMMAMMMVMMTVSMMVMAMSVMAVASAVPTMSAVTVTAGESLARDSQRSSGQCQSSDRGRNDRLDLRHDVSWVGQSEDRPAMIHL